MPMSRRCIPYTPCFRELRESIFALVTTAGVHLEDQEPYVEDDNSWRLISGDVQASQLMITHDHYDHSEIEMTGIPTVHITVVPESSRQAGTPRAIYPKDFRQGNSLGGPYQQALQRKVLLAALRRWETREEPGHIWEQEYPEYAGYPEFQ